MAIDPSISLNVRVPSAAQSINIFENALMNTKRRKLLTTQEQSVAGQNEDAADLRKIKSANDFAVRNASLIQDAVKTGDSTSLLTAFMDRRDQLIQQGLPTDETDEAVLMLGEGDLQGVVSGLGDAVNLFNQSRGTASQREFAGLTKGLSDEDALKSRRVKLGLDPRAIGSAAKTVDVGGVPHIFDPVKQTFVQAKVDGEKVTAETVSKSKALIKQRTKFAEMTGASRAKAIDKGFDSMAGIDKNIRNIDRAISALDRGARTGAVDKFLPTIRAASKELNQIQGELALDVVGAVTFGALSQGELDLARDVALPTGLDEPELKKWLQDKKTAQNKLRDYLGDQVQFLDQGGTVAGFLRAKEREFEKEDPTRIKDTTSFSDNAPTNNAPQDFGGFKILSIE